MSRALILTALLLPTTASARITCDDVRAWRAAGALPVRTPWLRWWSWPLRRASSWSWPF